MTADVDWYDVAHSLSNILLTSPRIDDALVLESILNTPLMSLRKRGYNVDRILNQQREERLRVEAESETTRRAAAEEKAREAKLGQPVAAAGRSTASPAGALEGAAPPPYGEQVSFTRVCQTNPQNKFWNQTQGSIMDMVRNRITSKRPTTSSPTDGVKAIEGADSSPQSSGGHNHVHGPGTQGSKTTKRPTSLSDIRNTVLKAVNASRPENQSQFQNSRRSVADVSESQGQYCDDSAEANLFLGECHNFAQLTVSLEARAVEHYGLQDLVISWWVIYHKFHLTLRPHSAQLRPARHRAPVLAGDSRASGECVQRKLLASVALTLSSRARCSTSSTTTTDPSSLSTAAVPSSAMPGTTPRGTTRRSSEDSARTPSSRGTLLLPTVSFSTLS